MSLAEEMLAKAGVKPEDQTAGAAAGAAAAINSEGAAAGAEGVENKPAAPTGEGAEAEKKTPELDRTKDGTVTVTDIAPAPTAPPTQVDSSSTASTIPETSPQPAADTDFEAKVLEYLAKKAGKEVKSIDEFIAAPAAKPADELTDEEKVAAQEKFNNDALRFALEQQLFSQKDLEAYTVDKARSPREIALRVFTDEMLVMDPKIAEAFKVDKAGTLAEIEERFQDAFFEHEEEDDWRRVRGDATMKMIAEGYINHKYEKVLDATDSFKTELDTQRSAGVYKANVEKVFSELPQHLKITIEGREYSYQIPETTRTNLKQEFLKPDTFSRLGGLLNEAELRNTITNAVSSTEQTKFITEVCKSYASTMIADIKMGRKHIPVTTDPSGTSQSASSAAGRSMAEVMLEKAMAKKPALAPAKP